MNAPVSFQQRISTLKGDIDTALEQHMKSLLKHTAKNFTPYSVLAVDAYSQVLSRGGKRMRGALTIIGYEMSGGKDHDMIIQAAAAIEMVHAYILVLDDIMDKSMKRRGGRSAHVLIADYHEAHELSGDSYHFGEAVAINGALIGNHYAQRLITNLSVADEYKVKALGLLNEALVVTGHGQINDLFNEVLDAVNETAVDNVLEWKTAHYSFLNPLQFGMALAGSNKDALDGIQEYCMHAGRAFQITDDILGTFGTEQDAGKSPMDDFREGKRTLLTITGLQKASDADKNFLIQMLGNARITQAEFSRCKEILVATGALEAAQQAAARSIAAAKASLASHASLWNSEGVHFLDALVGQLLGRTA